MAGEAVRVGDLVWAFEVVAETIEEVWLVVFAEHYIGINLNQAYLMPAAFARPSQDPSASRLSSSTRKERGPV